MEYCRAQVDIGMEMTDPMDLSAMWKGKGKGDKGGKYDKGGKNSKGKAKDGKGKNSDGKGKSFGGKAKRDPYDGYCSYCKKYGHKQQDCWAKARENASGSTATVENAEDTVPATAGSLLYGDQEECIEDRSLGWIFSLGLGDQPEPGDILIDSGAAMSVCAEQRSETQPAGTGQR